MRDEREREKDHEDVHYDLGWKRGRRGRRGDKIQ